MKIKKYNQNKKYENFLDLFSFSTLKNIIILIVIIFLSFFLFNIWFVLFDASKILIINISTYVLWKISWTVWEELKKDDLWQINILIIWYWWVEHRWWFLTDTLMISSFNPKIWAISFLSIPRDLYIEYNKNSFWRINWYFTHQDYINKDYEKSMKDLMHKVNDISWIPLDYYFAIDFNWFIKFIDDIWWIEIDVPYDLVDYQYPWPNDIYETFKVSKWVQIFDWKTALKYARSRHSTSDFSRSLRQQQIIKAVIKKTLSSQNLNSISKIKELYYSYNKIVKTNITIKNIFWMYKYLDKINNIFSFVYTAECDMSHFSVMSNWCFLYYPNRNDFWWASVILPQWASISNISNYKQMQDFAFFIIYNQKFLIENPTINIVNWISNTALKKKYWYAYPIANNLWVKLKNYWFNVRNIENLDKNTKNIDKTYIYINWTWDYSTNLELLRMFVNIDKILTWSINYKNDISIILWDDYLSLN